MPKKYQESASTDDVSAALIQHYECLNTKFRSFFYDDDDDDDDDFNEERDEDDDDEDNNAQ